MDEWIEDAENWIAEAGSWIAGAFHTDTGGRLKKKGPRRPKNIRRRWFQDKEANDLAAKRKTGTR